MTLIALNKTLDFIDENELDIKDRIEYITFSMGYFIYGDNQELSEDRAEFLIDWFNKINFTNMTNPKRRDVYYRLIHMIPEE